MESNFPIKIGFLQHDLYSNWIEHDNEDYDVFITETEVNSIIEKIKSCFHVVISAGAQFECYVEDNEELWYKSDNLGGFSYSDVWANKHLKNIENL